MTNSETLFAAALRYIPGGVNSPVRAFRAVGGQPFFVNRAKGSRVWDVDGREYIDYVCTWGPAILGHAHPAIIRAVQEAAEHGTSFGIPNPLEVTLARMVCDAVPSVQGNPAAPNWTAARPATMFANSPAVSSSSATPSGAAPSRPVRR